MRRALVLLTGFVAVLATPPEPAATHAEDPLAALLAAHCRARAELGTLRARFVQTRIFALVEEVDRSTGTLFYRKPDALRWQYTTPDSSYTVLRGDSGWASFPDIRQVQRFRVRESKAAAALALVGLGRCAPDFERSFRIAPGGTQGDAPVLVLVPTAPDLAAAFLRIELVLDPRLYLPREVSLHEVSGDTQRFEFLDLEPGARLDAALFEYTVPKGYEVVG
jgi:outer membrane lipoprotein carrier protein